MPIIVNRIRFGWTVKQEYNWEKSYQGHMFGSDLTGNKRINKNKIFNFQLQFSVCRKIRIFLWNFGTRIEISVRTGIFLVLSVPPVHFSTGVLLSGIKCTLFANLTAYYIAELTMNKISKIRYVSSVEIRFQRCPENFIITA